MKEVVGPDRRAVAVKRLTAGVAAVAEIEVRDLLLLFLQMQHIAFLLWLSKRTRPNGAGPLLDICSNGAGKITQQDEAKPW